MTIIWMSSVILGMASLYVSHRMRNYLNWIVFALLLLLMSCNNFCIDEMNILHSYQVNDFSKEVFLFNALMSTGRVLKLPFGWFNFFTIMIALAVITSALKSFTSNWGFVLGLYSLASAILDISLFRQFIASSVIVLGLRYLVIENNIIKYIFSVIVAMCIHTSMIIYIIFAIAGLKQAKKTIFLIDIGTALYIAATLLNGRIPPGIRLISKVINTNGRLEWYIQSAAGGLGWLYPLSWWVLSMVLSCTAWKSVSTELSPKEKKWLLKIYQINQLSFVFMPLCLIYMVSFSRLYRPLIWIQLLTIVIARQSRKNGRATKLQTIVLRTYIVWYFFSFNYLIYDWNEVVLKILNGTMFFT